MKILIADDERNLRIVLMKELAEEGHATADAASGASALDLLKKEEFDVVLLDLNMPGPGGIEVLKRIRTLETPPEVIILTGNATITTAVEAMKLGAYDYVTKPFNLAELKAIIARAREKKKLLIENIALKTQIRQQSVGKKIVTCSPVMIEILDTSKKVALSDFPILICGESGVGKELVAWTFHEASDRRGGPFIPINCGAIPENMMETELFGHEKGSFTGAHARKPGLLEIADNGTLFFDEIGEMPIRLQTKLLRVIDSKSFFRLGGVSEIKVDTKFLFATNKDLRVEVENGNFRHDLYYRLSALTVNVPPLRERKDDVPLLIEHFIQGMPAFRKKKFSAAALKAATGYSWPGNVRELKNVVHRTLLLSGNDVIQVEDLPSELLNEACAPGRRLEDVEKSHILKVLKEVHGQRGTAAEILDIDPKTLYRKLMSYGIKG